ncbi:hypothetical protein E4582_10215 [Luteimonas yindakuii]|uniref:Uncharacterized protein n=1 Tax=Luteimonas yindakuii TaxID=2565782 RepID=A0A4Z1RE44_9GAMM|nr:hypothetical protein [Luteimonas yindakuii]QCO68634.1 hypothetical protein E5843_14190 [Luteimonas yindakuii]TKS55098.1 hypothetical protein E4582_10215 [Luteimonas yindakuii]
MLLRVVVTCLACVLAAPGCQRGLDTTAQLPPPLPTTGAPAPAPLALPDDFPADLYLPPGYDLRSMMDVDGTRVVGVQVHGNMGALFADARAGMQGLGWRQTLALQRASDGAMLSFEKGPRAAVLWFRPVAPGTVQLQLQLREDMRMALR